jgi:hypothetical protein
VTRSDGARALHRGWTLGMLVFAAATVAEPARAVERENHVGVDLGASMLVVNGKSSPDVGGGAAAHWTYGLTDAFNLMVEGGWSLLALGEKVQGASTPRTRPAWGANADVGIAYVFDVMRWVPYVGLLGGGYAFAGGTIQGTKWLAGGVIALGVDYRFNRSLAAGVAVRQHMLTDPGTYPSFTLTFARLEYTWGW